LGVYIVKSDGNTELMQVVACKDEDRERQTLLQRNPDLLPGDQIDPDDPCRWMLIKREMPVPDPVTGTGRWSIDFLFIDQNAVPTFVECKRYTDTRARREVIGQVLEYVANAQRDWSGELLHSVAEATVKENSRTLEGCVRELQVADFKTTESFFAKAEDHLKNAVVRIVFFLEQAPQELKRLVEFLNSQMISSDVLLVEARQYEKNGLKIVAPRLYEFTEQARRTKELPSGARGRQPVATDWSSFKNNALTKGLSESTLTGIRSLYDACEELAAEMIWGRGVSTGSFSPKWSTLCENAAPFSIYANGRLEMHFSSLKTSDTAQQLASSLADEMKNLGFKVPATYLAAWYSYEASEWLPFLDAFIKALRDVNPQCIGKGFGSVILD
jgi:hypothetical protein